MKYLIIIVILIILFIFLLNRELFTPNVLNILQNHSEIVKPNDVIIEGPCDEICGTEENPCLKKTHENQCNSSIYLDTNNKNEIKKCKFGKNDCNAIISCKDLTPELCKLHENSKIDGTKCKFYEETGECGDVTTVCDSLATTKNKCLGETNNKPCLFNEFSNTGQKCFNNLTDYCASQIDEIKVVNGEKKNIYDSKRCYKFKESLSLNIKNIPKHKVCSEYDNDINKCNSMPQCNYVVTETDTGTGPYKKCVLDENLCDGLDEITCNSDQYYFCNYDEENEKCATNSLLIGKTDNTTSYCDDNKCMKYCKQNYQCTSDALDEYNIPTTQALIKNNISQKVFNYLDSYDTSANPNPKHGFETITKNVMLDYNYKNKFLTHPIINENEKPIIVKEDEKDKAIFNHKQRKEYYDKTCKEFKPPYSDICKNSFENLEFLKTSENETLNKIKKDNFF